MEIDQNGEKSAAEKGVLPLDVLREQLTGLDADMAPLVEHALHHYERWSAEDAIPAQIQAPGDSRDNGNGTGGDISEFERDSIYLLRELGELIEGWPDANVAGDSAEFRSVVELLIRQVEARIRERLRTARAATAPGKPVAPAAIPESQPPPSVERILEPAAEPGILDVDLVSAITYPYPEVTPGRREGSSDPVRQSKVNSASIGADAVWPQSENLRR